MTKDLRIKLLILVFVVSFFSATRSQSEPSDAERLKALNTEVVEKFRAGKLDDAAKAAQLLADLTSRVLGKDDVETAVAFSNLGEIYSRKQNDGLAYSNYQTAWNIYKRNAFKNPGEAGKVLTRLAQLSLSVRKVDPLRNEIEALMSAAEAEDATAKLIYPYILSVLTMIYTNENQFDKADSVFLKRYAAFTKLTRQNLEAFEGLEDDRFFFESTISNRKDVKKNLRPVYGCRKVTILYLVMFFIEHESPRSFSVRQYIFENPIFRKRQRRTVPKAR